MQWKGQGPKPKNNFIIIIIINFIWSPFFFCFFFQTKAYECNFRHFSRPLLASYADILWARHANVCCNQGKIPSLMFARVLIPASEFVPREVQKTPVWPFHDYVDITSVDLNTLLAKSWKIFNTWRKIMIMVFRRYFRLLCHRLPKLKIRWCMRQLVYIENCPILPEEM